MIDLIVPSLYLLAGASLYASCIHCYAGLRLPRNIPQILLAGMAGMVFLFAVFHGMSLRAQNLDEYVSSLKWSLGFSIMCLLMLLWFIAFYTEKRPVILLAGLSAASLVLVGVNFAQPYSLQYADIAGLERLRLPWGESITQAVGTNSAWFYFGLVGISAGFVFAFTALIGHYRRHPSPAHLGMVFAVGFLFVCLLQGILVRLAVIHFVHLGWLGYLGMMVAMSLASSYESNQRFLEKEAKLRGLYELSPLGIALTDMQGRYIKFNEAFRRICGYADDELKRLDYWTLTPKEYEPQEAIQLELLRRNGHYGPYEKEYIRSDGFRVPIRLNGMLITGADGQNYIWSIVEDVSEWKQIQNELSQSEERYRRIVETSNEGIWSIDAQFKTSFVNAAMCQMLGYRPDEMQGRAVNEFVCEEDLSDLLRQLDLRKQGISSNYVSRFRHKDGSICWCSISSTTLKDERGRFAGSFAMFTDITKEKANEDLIWRQANYDTLTDLPNRRMVYDRMHEEIKKSRRDRKHMAVLFIDLDRFKDVNDSLGHEVGDSLLTEAAKRMAHCVRESDIIGRLGGDEFIVILNELEDANSVGQIANKLLDTLAAPYPLGIEMAYISASIGITLFPDDACDATTLLRNADQAMYAAKRQGRNRFHYYTPAMQEAANARMRLTQDMHVALEDEQFRVYYQPIVELGSGNICKAEALVRWQHPRLGLVSPADFIPIAEDTGQIIAIGDWVFRQAAAQSALFRDRYHSEFQISVNASPVQFKVDFDHRVSWFEYLDALGLSGQCIVVEITESLLMETQDEVKNLLLAMRDNGMQVALDDFGTGYSSLAYLKKLDIDFLKIDQSFVRNLAPDSNDMVLCEAMIVMAHKLGIKVIAEGVETPEQRDLLKKIGCDYGQGYFWSKPMPADDFEKLLSKA